jgi:hypothetical protein
VLVLKLLKGRADIGQETRGKEHVRKKLGAIVRSFRVDLVGAPRNDHGRTRATSSKKKSALDENTAAID